MPIVYYIVCAAGGCCQVAAEAENSEDCTEVGTTCWWQAMNQRSMTSLIINKHCVFVAELLSLNLSEIYHVFCLA